MVYREEESINPLSRDHHQRARTRDPAAGRKRESCDSDNSVGSCNSENSSREISGDCFAMSRKKVWNSIIRRKKKNHMDFSGKEESDSGSASPLLRRVTTFPRSGMKMRHTMDPDMSMLCVHDPNHLFVESELKSLSLPRSFPPEITVTQHYEGESKRKSLPKDSRYDSQRAQGESNLQT
ncbi:uncharacterized protein LOC143261143 [Megalopta genalis]|uniref:uncharacterized protein LOC143261143 n=1 Tax=Megalopta genalis TaxID=115081 RepID=UPI003FD4D0B5